MQQSNQTSDTSPGIVFVLALAAISFIGPLAVHIFLPILPGIRAAFKISDSLAQMNFSISLFTMAFATLVYGSLSDRFGRRPVLLSGLMFFAGGTLLCVFAQSIETLLIGRFVQAVGAGCGITLVRTIARDAYGAQGLAKAIAYLTMAYTLGPMFAPLIGGSLFDSFGWRSVFIFAFGCSAIILLVAYTIIPETKPPAYTLAKRGNVLRDYDELFSYWRFMAFVMQTGMSSAVFYTMASAASGLMKDILERPASDYGLWFLTFPAGYFIGNWFATRFTARARDETMVLIGTCIGFVAAAVQSGFLLADIINPMVLFLPGFFTTFAQGVAMPYAQSGAMNTVPRLVGTASGIGVFLQSFLGALFAQLYGMFADGTVIPMVVVVMGAVLLMTGAGVLPWLFRKKQ